MPFHATVASVGSIDYVTQVIYIISSPEPKAHGELIVYQWSRRPSVRAFTLLNINISETSGPIADKFYLKHHWGGGKAALVLSKIGLEPWCPWQRIAPIGL